MILAHAYESLEIVHSCMHAEGRSSALLERAWIHSMSISRTAKEISRLDMEISRSAHAAQVFPFVTNSD